MVVSYQNSSLSKTERMSSTHGHGLWLQEGGKIFICRRGNSDFLSREGISFCAAGGGKGGDRYKRPL